MVDPEAEYPRLFVGENAITRADVGIVTQLTSSVMEGNTSPALKYRMVTFLIATLTDYGRAVNSSVPGILPDLLPEELADMAAAVRETGMADEAVAPRRNVQHPAQVVLDAAASLAAAAFEPGAVHRQPHE